MSLAFILYLLLQCFPVFFDQAESINAFGVIFMGSEMQLLSAVLRHEEIDDFVHDGAIC
jgi:hypothetical protein